jgi:hypothetical protein
LILSLKGCLADGTWRARSQPGSSERAWLARILCVQVYGLTSSQSPQEALDLFLTQEAAELHEILEDEPDWRDVLRVVPIKLDERNVSAN